MPSLLKQIKKRRTELGLRQHDMMMRAGISRQQYQRLESRGNPRLDTLELVAGGLRSELLLIPREKLSAVLAVLSADSSVANAGRDEAGKDNSKERFMEILAALRQGYEEYTGKPLANFTAVAEAAWQAYEESAEYREAAWQVYKDKSPADDPWRGLLVDDE